MLTPVLEELHTHLHRTGVIAVLMMDNAKDAVPAARALLAGGVDCIELTLRAEAAMGALKRIRSEVPEILVGVGTILTPQQVEDVKASGAAFGVAPGMNPRVVAEAQRVGLPFAPGICTPTDIELAIEQGCRLLKFFPSEPCSGRVQACLRHNQRRRQSCQKLIGLISWLHGGGRESPRAIRRQQPALPRSCRRF